MIAFAELLERLVFTPGRLAKTALLRRYFATEPDPEADVEPGGQTPAEASVPADDVLVESTSDEPAEAMSDEPAEAMSDEPAETLGEWHDVATTERPSDGASTTQ